MRRRRGAALNIRLAPCTVGLDQGDEKVANLVDTWAFVSSRGDLLQRSRKFWCLSQSLGSVAILLQA